MTSFTSFYYYFLIMRIKWHRGYSVQIIGTAWGKWLEILILRKIIFYSPICLTMWYPVEPSEQSGSLWLTKNSKKSDDHNWKMKLLVFWALWYNSCNFNTKLVDMQPIFSIWKIWKTRIVLSFIKLSSFLSLAIFEFYRVHKTSS